MSSPIAASRRTRIATLTFVVMCALAVTLLTVGPIKTARAGNTWQVDKTRSSTLCNSDNLVCASLKDAVREGESSDTIRITVGRYDAENDILIESKNLTIIGAGQP